jgi:hypothetical protein
MSRSRTRAFLALTVLAGTLLGSVTSGAPAQAASAERIGNDVSWPQCPASGGVGYGLPMPGKSSKFVIVGLTRGRGFAPNPCVRWQVDHAKRRHLYTAAYAFTSYPTSAELRRYGNSGPYRGSDPVTRLRNVGYRQAWFNVGTMRRAALRTPIVWVDVEPSARRPWTKNTAYNAAVIEGVIRGYQKAGLKVGIYSTVYLWDQIAGTAEYGLPEWRTAGKRGYRVAQRRCAEESIQGGEAVLAQWWTSRVDYDLTCPGHGTIKGMTRYFRKY